MDGSQAPSLRWIRIPHSYHGRRVHLAGPGFRGLPRSPGAPSAAPSPCRGPGTGTGSGPSCSASLGSFSAGWGRDPRCHSSTHPCALSLGLRSIQQRGRGPLALTRRGSQEPRRGVAVWPGGRVAQPAQGPQGPHALGAPPPTCAQVPTSTCCRPASAPRGRLPSPVQGGRGAPQTPVGQRPCSATRGQCSPRGPRWACPGPAQWARGPSGTEAPCGLQPRAPQRCRGSLGHETCGHKPQSTVLGA